MVVIYIAAYLILIVLILSILGLSTERKDDERRIPKINEMENRLY